MTSLEKKERRILFLEQPILLSYEHLSDMMKFGTIDEKTKICYPVLMNLDDQSRNSSVYHGPDFIKSMEESIYIQEMIKTGCWFGELTHPPVDSSQERFMTVDHNNISHRIHNYKINGNVITGKVQFVPPKGDIVWSWVQTGSNLAFSVRVLTPTYVKKKNENGQVYIFKYGRMMLVTFDCVFVPGFRNARMIDPDKYDASLESWKLTPEIERFKNSISTEDWSKIMHSCLVYEHYHDNDYGKVQNSDLKSLMKSQEAIKILEDLFEFNLDEAPIHMSKENVEIKINKSETIKIPTNTYLINTIINAKNNILNK